MRKIAVVSVSRSDYGLWRPVLRALEGTRGARASVIAAGTHLSRRFGSTEREIAGDGFRISARVPTVESSDSPAAVARSMSRALSGFAAAYARLRPDIVMVLGDRYEMHAAALAALPFTLPVAHVHGGELTEGAFDDSLRHSITKLSHLHFVAAPEYARRVLQLGEEPWRVAVSGAPALDNLRALRLLPKAKLERALGMSLDAPPVVLTFHPVTLEPGQAARQTKELLGALSAVDRPLVFTMPNVDPGHAAVRTLIERFVARRRHAKAFESLGTLKYFSLLAQAAAMAGNSSSGLLEAPSFELPVVNVGSRQGGRLRALNVIDAPCRRADIRRALEKALRPAFRARLRGLRSPFGDGRAGALIARRVATVPLDARLAAKRFVDLPGGRHG